MKIVDKLSLDRFGLEEHGPITIVAFGASVTQGAFEIGEKNDYDAVYWNLLRKKIIELTDYVPVNVINAGIGGTTASASVERLDKQVLAHNPDLVIVCFGLNDVNYPVEDFLQALTTIFTKIKAFGCDVIYLTPNMLNTYVADDTVERFKDYAKVTSEYQNSGKMDLYISSAVKLAKELEVTVCDCYSVWKELSKTQDITMLLSNRINHPTREMHNLFAESLFNAIFKDTDFVKGERDDTMFKE